METFLNRFKSILLFAWVLLPVFSGEAQAATVSCTKSGITCAAPYDSCSGTNCTNICASPASYGYSAYGTPDVYEDCGTSSCTQKFSNYANLTITASAGAGGTITPSGARTIAQGQTTSFTAAPNAGYSFVNFTSDCPGSPAGATYSTGAITNDCYVTANFVASYTVSASAGANGTVSPASQTIFSGNKATFTVTPNAGYSILSATGCGGSMTSATVYTTAIINAACTVSVTFGHTVSTSTPVGGKFTPASRAVATSDTTTFTVTALNGYSITGVTGCGGTLSGSTYTTGAITGACTVTATLSGSAAGPITCYRAGSSSDCLDYLASCAGTDCNTYCANPTAYGLTRTSHSFSYDYDYEEYSCTDIWSAGTTTYTVTPSVYGGGTISPNTAQTVNSGSTKAFTLTPNTGYAIYNVTGTCGGSLSGSTFTTSAVNANCTVIGNFAAGTDGYRLNSGQEIMVYAHTVCKKITNNNASAIFIPTKTATEWLQFRTNATGITQANCP